MSYSFTSSDSITFTLTHAKHLGAKVATDLKRMQRFYGYPSDSSIADYEAEIIEFLKNGYLGTVTYGFKRGDDWIEPTLRYSARELNEVDANDDDPGKVRPGADISGASFYSFMTYSSKWYQQSESERNTFSSGLPFQRRGANEPGISGYLTSDRTYSSGGRALDRSTVKSF
jgi:hypothetical protein